MHFALIPGKIACQNCLATDGIKETYILVLGESKLGSRTQRAVGAGVNPSLYLPSGGDGVKWPVSDSVQNETVAAQLTRPDRGAHLLPMRPFHWPLLWGQAACGGRRVCLSRQ